MTLYRFHDTKDSKWLQEYNAVISRYEKGLLQESSKQMTLHHIIPRSIDATLKNDKRNHIYLSFYDHAMMHYYLWKHDRRYAQQLWFIAVYGRKYGLWDFPAGDAEYEELKRDLCKNENYIP